MSVYTEVFGGNTIYPSDVSYAQFDLTADTPTFWPLDANTGAPVLARIVDIVPTGAYALLMPDATLTGPGQTVLFNNLGPSTITIESYTGTTLASIAAGEAWQIYLTDNSTAAGTWQVFQFGASTAQAQASALAGYGLTATGSTLSQSAPTSTLSSTYTVGASDRAKLFVWTSGLGTVNLPSVSSVMNGFFVSFNNQGAGNWTIDGNGSDTIDGAATLVLAPGESVTLATDTLAWYSLGLGPQVQSNFDYTSIDLTGQSSPYTLSGAELNRVAYDFVGILSGDMEVVVPSTIQEYWVTNSTTGGSYTLGFRTAAQTPAVTVARGSRGIYYCTGSDFVDADTGGLATPISVAQGGTGATTAGAALTNLGGTAIGTALFTAATTSNAQTTLGATATGSSLFTAADAAAGRTTLGATSVGSDLFTAASASAARTTLGSTAVGDALFTTASASAARTTLGATTVGSNLFTAVNAAAAQSTLALIPGTDIQAYSANLQAISGVTSAANKLFYFTGSGTGAVTDFTSQARNFVATTTGSAALATLFTPGVAQNVIVSDGAGGWAVSATPLVGNWYLASTTTLASPAASITLNSFPTTYGVMELELSGFVPVTPGPGVALNVTISNGSNTATFAVTAGQTTQTACGSVVFMDYRANIEEIRSVTTYDTASVSATATGTTQFLVGRHSGGITSVTLAYSSGNISTGASVKVKFK